VWIFLQVIICAANTSAVDARPSSVCRSRVKESTTRFRKTQEAQFLRLQLRLVVKERSVDSTILPRLVGRSGGSLTLMQPPYMEF
jgi:hypothetical protein